MNSWSSSWYLLSPIKLSLLFFILIFLPCLDECHCLIFEFGDPFFCLMWSDESLYWIFQFNYCIFQLCDLFGTFKYVLFVEISFGLCTVLLASVVLVLNFLSSKSLISISLRSISEVLTCSFIWHIILSSSFSLTLCIDVCASAKTTAFPQVLCREWTYHSAWSELWVVSQTFMMLSKLFSVTRSSWRYVELLLHVGILLFTQCVAVTLLISGFLSEGVASCVSAGLVCPWEEVRSGAFYVPSCTGTLSRACQSNSYLKTFSEPSSPQQQSLGASYIFSFISCSEHTAFRMRYLNISPSAETQLSKGPQHPWSPLSGNMPYREPLVKVSESNLGEGKL